MLQVKNLVKMYKEKPVLQNCSLEVKRGELCILLGASGVGKSTLLRVLNGLESFHAGELTLDGKPLISKQSVGMVFQHFNLFEHLSVLENITLPLIKVQKKAKNVAHSIAEEELKRYGLSSYRHASIKTLSGGQKQRLSLARACAMNPEIICLDEPTSALDPKLTGEVASYIQEFAKQGKMVLMTTHDTNLLSQVSACLFLMQHGQVVESCHTHELDSSRFPKLFDFLR